MVEPTYDVTPAPPAAAPTVAKIDPAKLQSLMREVKERQNLPLGIAAGAGAMIVAAVVWAVVTAVANIQIGYMAVGVGFLVGFAIRFAGKGVSATFGWAGAALSLTGCVGGNILTMAIVLAKKEEASVLSMLGFFATSPGTVLDLLKTAFHPMDIVFYLLAVYFGFKYSFREINAEELAKVAK